MSIANWIKMRPENCQMKNFDPDEAFISLLRTRSNISTFWLTEVIPRVLGKKKL